MKKRYLVQDIKKLKEDATLESKRQFTAGHAELKEYWKGQADAYKNILERIESRRY